MVIAMAAVAILVPSNKNIYTVDYMELGRKARNKLLLLLTCSCWVHLDGPVVVSVECGECSTKRTRLSEILKKPICFSHVS